MIGTGALLGTATVSGPPASSLTQPEIATGTAKLHRKRLKFPSGVTPDMQPTIQSWFSQKLGERRVAPGDGDR